MKKPLEQQLSEIGKPLEERLSNIQQPLNLEKEKKISLEESLIELGQKKSENSLRDLANQRNKENSSASIKKPLIFSMISIFLLSVGSWLGSYLMDNNENSLNQKKEIVKSDQKYIKLEKDLNNLIKEGKFYTAQKKIVHLTFENKDNGADKNIGAIYSDQNLEDLIKRPSYFFNVLACENNIKNRNNSDINKSIKDYEEEIDMFPGEAFNRYILAYLYANKGDINEVIKQSKKVLEINSNVGQAHNILGYAYFKKGDLEGAIKETEKALRLDPNNAANNFNLGVYYEKKGNLKKAANEFKKAINLEPLNAHSRIHLGEVYYDLNEIDKAINEFEAIFNLSVPISSKLYNTLGSLYNKKGDYDKAVNYTRKAIKLDSSNKLYKENLDAIHHNKKAH